MTQKNSKKCSKTEKSELHCTFCDKEFVREKAFINHLCEKKRRFLERDTKFYYIAYTAFNEFFRISYGKKMDATKFDNSQFYTAFIKFGKYVLDINAIDVPAYIKFLVKGNIGIDDWCKDRVYEKYVRELAMQETPERAVERTTQLMLSWTNSKGGLIKDFFRDMHPNVAIQLIRSGRISPWVLFNCESGVELLTKFNDEQLAIGGEALNSKLWKGKFSRHTEYVYEIQDTLKEIGL